MLVKTQILLRECTKDRTISCKSTKTIIRKLWRGCKGILGEQEVKTNEEDFQTDENHYNSNKKKIAD